jgi:hypothetical protein
MALMAILGGVLIWKEGKKVLWEGRGKIFSLLFLCIWIPIVISVPDSFWLEKSLGVAASFPRIYLAGIYLIWVLADELARKRLLRLAAWLLLFWTADALIQAVIGYDLLGYRYPERLNGIFGPSNWKLGLTLAMLAPIVWEYVAREGSKWQLALAWLGTAAVVMLGNNRESWVVFAIATLLWGWRYAGSRGFHPLRMMIPMGLAGIVVVMGAYQANPKFAERVDTTLRALDFSYEGLNAATNLRMHLWSNSLKVIENHPVNGIGVRAYRYAYVKFAETDDPYITPQGTGMAYAHQLVLEVASETGLIGLAGLLMFLMIYLRLGKTGQMGNSLALATWVGATAWLFPLNTHSAFFSAYWSLLIFWMVAISIAEDHQEC